MSTLPPKADIAGRRLDVRFVPNSDIGEFHRSSQISACTNVLACFETRVGFFEPPHVRHLTDVRVASWSPTRCVRRQKVATMGIAPVSLLIGLMTE